MNPSTLSVYAFVICVFVCVFVGVSIFLYLLIMNFLTCALCSTGIKEGMTNSWDSLLKYVQWMTQCERVSEVKKINVLLLLWKTLSLVLHGWLVSKIFSISDTVLSFLCFNFLCCLFKTFIFRNALWSKKKITEKQKCFKCLHSSIDCEIRARWAIRWKGQFKSFHLWSHILYTI